jgi:ribose-phosphate pyrophosphokinase
MKVISTENSQILSTRLALALGAPLCDVRYSRFPDGELYLRASELDGEMVIIGSVTSNEALMQLLLLIDACEGRKNHLVVPYMGYARQDRIFNTGEALSARAVARALSNGVEDVTIVNIHEESVLSHFRTDARSVSLEKDIASFLRSVTLEHPLLMAPDEGASTFVRKIASLTGWDWDYLNKTRLSGEQVRIAPKSLDVTGRDVVIVDDIISTGGTLATAAGMLLGQSGRSVSAVCVHGVFTTGALLHLHAAGVKEVVCSDTIERACSRISAAETLACSIRDFSK